MAFSSVAGPVVSELMAQYEGVKTLSCSVRRDMENPGGGARMLSRVFYQRSNKMHIQTFSPSKRRYVSDGERMYYHNEGEPKGFSCSLDQLPPEWMVPDLRIPGSALDHLSRLREGEEKELEPTDEFPRRVAVQAENAFAVLSLDARNRLARLEFFRTSDMSSKMAQYDYSQFKDISDGISIPCLHQAALNIGAQEAKETVRIENLTVNQPIPGDLFVAAPFFKDVLFAESFKNIYE